MARFGVIAVVLLGWLAAGALAAERQSRYSALLANGQRLTGNKLSDWHEKAALPKLDGQPLLEPSNSFRWIRDRSLQLATLPAAYVEFHGGDRLPGTAVEYRSGQEQAYDPLPPHLIVRTAVNFEPPENKPVSEIRVATASIRRIVWQRRGRQPFQPGTAFYRDGRSVAFRAIRLVSGQVHLLLSEGDRRIPWSELAEVHFPRVDAWEAHFDELAILCPTIDTRLIQFETSSGLVATASLARFVPRFEGNSADADRWVHGLQPAWSLDILWIPCREIAYRRSYLPREALLARIEPEVAMAESAFADSQSFEINRSDRGGPLRSKSLDFGFGLGVHARSELAFDLPPGVRSVRMQACLDRSAGKGGCIRASLFANQASGNPLWQSPILVGSEQVADTGIVALSGIAGGQKRLVLAVDPVATGRPAGADPFNVRDHVNWCDPVLELDPVEVQKQLDSRLGRRFLAWRKWKASYLGAATAAEAGLEISWHRNERLPQPGTFHPAVQVKTRPLLLSRRITVGPDDHWLLIAATRPLNRGQEPKLEIRIGGEAVGELVVPERQQDADENRPLAISLTGYQRTPPRAIDVEIRQLAFPESAPVEYRTIQTADQLPTLYRAFEEQGELTSTTESGAGTATIVDDDRYYGSHSIRLSPGGEFRLPLPGGVRIRERPGWGEFRFLRFAFRTKGGGRLSLGFEAAERRTGPRRLDAGQGQPSYGDAIRVWQDKLPQEWVVITRDLFNDSGQLDLTALTLGCPDGEQALFDHIYFARSHQDFDRIAGAPRPEQTNEKARQELVKPILEKARPATVRIEYADGRAALGVLLRHSPPGEILTTGHAVIGPNRPAVVQLADGTTLSAKTLGVAREFDVGLLKLDAPPASVGLEPHAPPELPQDRLYLALLQPRRIGELTPATADVVQLRRVFRSNVWTDLEPADWIAGGPLIDRDGRLIGIQTRVSRFGGVLCTRLNDVWPQLQRIRNGEVWGAWPVGSEPLLGLAGEPTLEGYKLKSIVPQSPAAQAALEAGDSITKIDGKAVVGEADLHAALAERDAGQEVTLDYTRAKVAKQAKVKLAPRDP